MTVRQLESADAALLDDLIDSYPFKAYRNYRILSRDRQSAVLRAEIERLTGTPDHIGVTAAHGDGTAIAIGRPLTWDSEFFGLPMGRLDVVLRSASAKCGVVGQAVDAVLEQFRQAGVQHVTAKVDVADADLVHVLEAAGFRLMDAIVTYIAHPKRPPPRPVKEVGRIRPYIDADREQVLDVTREAYQDFKGRFQIDPHIPRDRSDAFYLEWARKCCDGAMADRIYVAEDGAGKLIGWASVKTAEPASSVGGARISSGSLGACRRDHPGAYGGLICRAAVENHAAGILTEALTQNSNFSMIRVLEAVGAQYARAEYSFHAWLG